jgi:hypothetical protein
MENCPGGPGQFRRQAALLTQAGPFDLFQILSIALSSKMQNMIFLLLQIFQTLHAHRKIQIEQFFFLVQLPNLSRF